MAAEFNFDNGGEPVVVQKFYEIFELSMVNDRKRHPKEADGSYRNYRAFNDTMWSGKLNSLVLSYENFREVTFFLLSSMEFGPHFTEWLRLREFDWEFKTLPRNAYNIYTIGKREIEKRLGKRH